MIIDPADKLPEPLSPLKQDYRDYCNREMKAKRKPDPIMEWARAMHEDGNYDPFSPDLIPIPFEESDFYEELSE